MLKLEEIADIREYIKKQVEEMDENTTVNAGEYDTPNAFTGDSKDDGTQAVDLSDPEYAYSIKAPKKRRNSIKLHELSYKDYKKDGSRTAVQKINSNILEVNKNIRILAQSLNHSIKLKTEQKLTDDVHWKKTNEALRKMHHRISVLTEKANELYNLNEANANQIKDKLIDLLSQALTTKIDPKDVEYNTVNSGHFEFDVMLEGEPYAFDYNKNQLIYMGYDKEVVLGNINQEDVIVKNLQKALDV